MNKMWARKQTGFTIVELLIVIVVIAILAAISIVAYNGIQQRARDAHRQSDLSAIDKSLKIYEAQQGSITMVGSGCGQYGDGTGWINVSNSGHSTYQTSILDCLKNAGVLSPGTTLVDPLGTADQVCNGLNCFKYGKYNCPDGVYLFAHLESRPQTSTDTDATCRPAYDTEYGYNYYKKIN